MSTFYGITCLTCDEQTGTGVKNDPDLLWRIIDLAPLIAALLAADERCDIKIEPVDFWDFDESPFPFLEDHNGHNLAVYDEYGRLHFRPESTVESVT